MDLAHAAHLGPQLPGRHAGPLPSAGPDWAAPPALGQHRLEFIAKDSSSLACFLA